MKWSLRNFSFFTKYSAKIIFFREKTTSLWQKFRQTPHKDVEMSAFLHIFLTICSIFKQEHYIWNKFTEHIAKKCICLHRLFVLRNLVFSFLFIIFASNN